MAHKKNLEGENLQVKTICLKSRLSKEEVKEKWLPIINEYNAYYNRMSDYICSLLGTNITIGEFADQLSEKKRTNGYFTICQDAKFKNEPFYKIFHKLFPVNHGTNIINNIISEKNIDQYDGNTLGFRPTMYRLRGYVDSVIGNYRTTIRTIKPSVKRHKISVDSSFDEKMEQCIYEIQKGNLKTVSDWNNKIDYLLSKSDMNPLTIERFNLLRDFYVENETEVHEKCNNFAIKELVQFGGCHRKGDNMTLSLTEANFSIEEIDDNYGYLLTLHTDSGDYKIPLMGSKMLKNGDKCLIDFINCKKGKSLTAKIDNDYNLYFHFVVYTNFEKIEDDNINNVVGVDVNSKHMLLMTNVIDDNIDGYVNIYKALVNDDEFKTLVTKSEYDDYVTMSKYVTFCPIELNYLYARYCVQKDYPISNKDVAIEQCISRVIDKLCKQTLNSRANNYLCMVRRIRHYYKSYYVLKMAYYDKMSEYDTNMEYNDISTTSKETMDQRRFENSFRDTDCAKEILSKLDKIGNDILGCRNNILTYVYKLFEELGYDTIALENLESSQFDKMKSLPSCQSMLKYHKLEGKTMEDVMSNTTVKSLIENGYYDFLLNGSGVVENITYTKNGLMKKGFDEFFNLFMKIIHFADIKDKFVQLYNNGSVKVILVPSYFTSQMDSLNHSIYMEKSKNDKPVFASKHKVRKTQETHLNGLNADYNAACNIAYIAKDIKWREKFCKKMSDNGYSTPLYDCATKNQVEMVKRIKQLNAVKMLA